MTEKTYRHSRIVEYALCDHRGEARLSYLLAAAQQVSMEHCDHAGIGGGYFREHSLAFLLAKLRLDIPCPPCGGQTMELFTQPNLPVRAQYRRRTDFTAANGSMLAAMDARWVLVDIEHRRLLRRLPEGINMPFQELSQLVDFRPSPPQGLELREEVTVRCAMVDVNGHMNNAVYGDLITNLLEHRLMTDRRLRSIEIFYHREALPRDNIALYLQEDGDRFFIRGVVGSTVCFEACGTLQQLHDKPQ